MGAKLTPTEYFYEKKKTNRNVVPWVRRISYDFQFLPLVISSFLVIHKQATPIPNLGCWGIQENFISYCWLTGCCGRCVFDVNVNKASSGDVGRMREGRVSRVCGTVCLWCWHLSVRVWVSTRMEDTRIRAPHHAEWSEATMHVLRLIMALLLWLSELLEHRKSDCVTVALMDEVMRH